jgi:hypothetical protein
MTDLAEGSWIVGLDTPPVVYDANSATNENFSNNPGYLAPTNTAEITFIAPTTGRVLILTQIRADADNTTERIAWDVQVNEYDKDGTEVHAAGTVGDVAEWQWPVAWPAWASFFIPLFLEDLEPGLTYWAQLRYNATTIDIGAQQMIVIPMP